MVVELVKVLIVVVQQLVGGQFGVGGVVRINVIYIGDCWLMINVYDWNMLLDVFVYQCFWWLVGGDDNVGDVKLSEMV